MPYSFSKIGWKFTDNSSDISFQDRHRLHYIILISCINIEFYISEDSCRYIQHYIIFIKHELNKKKALFYYEHHFEYSRILRND